MTSTSTNSPAADRARAVAGDPEAFARLVEPLSVRLIVLIRRLAPRQARADCADEDLLQTALVRAWQILDRFEDRGPQSFARWLAQITRRTVQDRVRYLASKGRREVPQLSSLEEGFDVPASVTSIAHSVARREQIERLEVALESLPTNQRDVIAAHVLEARTLAEIAATLDITKNAVWERLQRGLATLRRALAELGDESA